MDYKALKKIADACRKAGIKHYKCAEFEFTLTDEAPVSNYKKRTSTNSELKDIQPNLIPSENLSDEDLLFWSSMPTETDESVQ